ncbi:hypothetical protein QFZ77_001820 [Paenibacillus sp. V4I3]|nr:hypothetical protein [Paenibacillus sp. V4I3]
MFLLKIIQETDDFVPKLRMLPQLRVELTTECACTENKNELLVVALLP